MKLSSKIMLFGLALFLVAAMIIPPSSQSSGGPTVIVQNTPLPVQGTVGVNNFPSNQAVSGTVGVSNFPATQTVNGTVNVGNFPSANSVQVSNTASSPVPIRDVENSGQFYFQGFCQFDQTVTSEQCDLVDVPSTANAVIDTISFKLETDQAPGGQPPLFVLQTTTAGKGLHWNLVPTFVEKLPLILLNLYNLPASPVRIYADAGQSIILTLTNTGNSTAFIAEMTITGHYVCTNNAASC